MDYRFEEFTEASYREFLKSASRQYEWTKLGEKIANPHAILRHDVDISPNRALSLAKIENEEGVRSAYLFMIRSEFYNFFEMAVGKIVREIAALGHQVGLHFDMSYYGSALSPDELAKCLAFEKGIIESVSGVECQVFSFHNPDTNSSLQHRAPIIAGMRNAYESKLFNEYKYISDSNGYWRFDSLFECIDAARYPRLYILIHPEWWVPEPMSPRKRVERAVQGRGAKAMSNYDAILAAWGRNNVS